MQTRKFHTFLLFFVLILSLTLFISDQEKPAWALNQRVILISVASNGTPGNGDSTRAAISANGCHVAFNSLASNLVTNDTNQKVDIFVHDCTTGETTRISVASNGTEGNDVSENADITADGRYVVFGSRASNLVENDTNETGDVFVHDRTTGATTLISSATNGVPGNGNSGFPTISADGRYIAFVSGASNLVANDANGTQDIFVHDRTTGHTSLISTSSDGTQGNFHSSSPSISADGRFVTFVSESSTLVTDDTNESQDIFVHDRATGETIRASVASDGTQGWGDSYSPDISADGSYVTFESDASLAEDSNRFSDIFIHNCTTGETGIVSKASNGFQGVNGRSSEATMSADGRYVAFYSNAYNLVAPNTAYPGIYLHNRLNGKTTLVSSDAAQSYQASDHPSISSDSRYVAFQTVTTNLVPEDTNEYEDIFVYDRFGDIDFSELMYLPFIAKP
ncbi:MAG: hypothetical protein R3D55_00030 [Chloroflexota bacterium]